MISVNLNISLARLQGAESYLPYQACAGRWEQKNQLVFITVLADDPCKTLA